jgi:acyl carrier protein
VNDELAIMRTFLKGRLDIEPARITPGATLAELEIDSLILLELFFEFEEQFGLNLAKDIPTPKTIGELVDIVKGLRRATAAG